MAISTWTMLLRSGYSVFGVRSGTQHRTPNTYPISWPPVTLMAWPVIYAAASEARDHHARGFPGTEEVSSQVHVEDPPPGFQREFGRLARLQDPRVGDEQVDGPQHRFYPAEESRHVFFGRDIGPEAQGRKAEGLC